MNPTIIQRSRHRIRIFPRMEFDAAAEAPLSPLRGFASLFEPSPWAGETPAQGYALPPRCGESPTQQMNAMNDSAPTTIDDEMELPQAGGPGLLIGYLIWYGMIGGIVSVAIWNVIHVNSMPLVTLAASFIVLVFVPFMTFSSICDHGGVSQFFVNRLGELCTTRFLSIEIQQDGKRQICLGYWFRRRRFYFCRVAFHEIISVSWHSGQATSHAGRDMNDWQTCMWYLTDRFTMISRLSHRDCGQLQDVISFGPWGSKEAVDAFGRTVIKFLFDHGAVLLATSDDRKFVNPELIDYPKWLARNSQPEVKSNNENAN